MKATLEDLTVIEEGCNDGIETIHDSMELDSGDDVLWLKGKIKGFKIDACIRVCGHVSVIYKDETYKAASQMPEELIDLFHKGEADNNEDVTINENNWFELIVILTDENCGDTISYQDLIDIDLEEECKKYGTPNKMFREVVVETLVDCFV